MNNRKFDDIWSIIFHGDEKAFDKIDVNELDRSKINYLQYAIAHKQDNIVKKLIERKIDVNNQDYKGRTPLIYSVGHKNYEITKLILENGGIIDIPDFARNTPLWYATFEVKGKDYKMVKLLVDAGADPSHLNKVNKTPIDMAKTFKDEKLLTILTESQ